MIRKGIIIGTISGLLLGFFLKGIEYLTGVKVYTLLLNVDFIPIIGDIQWPEFIEFFFHCIISFLIGILYLYIIEKSSNKWFGEHPLFTSFLITLPTIPLYFPLVLLAEKTVPPLWDIVAFTYWGLGHIVYFFSLYVSYKWLYKKG
ncbi:hypothetical protein Q73_04835 [Bacillus coahuilensis m2-6]|uniref:Uncharacterized protein n=1 Tax=Bacillus coahuilensis p1.1.43 TaxID=1150625 RepID=A0A147KAD8_9BACI|nr:hypothetical protein [Bacillus coahuilensis]KUP07662.1 hypothetical protein Q75_05400 [Bacillus coahuilensis p1.1.43]KUP08803.1 hypothetical protein Q73_04835 [Bacillus coahuilensis m2-6]